jgi:hypothetical protein
MRQLLSPLNSATVAVEKLTEEVAATNNDDLQRCSQKQSKQVAMCQLADGERIDTYDPLS